MFKSFTLLESLITLSLLIISIYFISPVIFNLKDNLLLNGEVENIQSFFYQIQTKSRYQQKSYTITISQNSHLKKWCLIAAQKTEKDKKEVICDCLNISSCKLNADYQLYRGKQKEIEFKSKNLYPKSFINIDGVAGRLESKCLDIILNKQNKILLFDQIGRIYPIPKSKRSNCEK